MFLYTGGRYNTVSELMTAKYGRGWSLRSCETKIPEFYKAMSKNLRPYITWNNDRVAHATNNTSGLLTPDPSITVDTVPLYVDAWPRCFQPKYSEYVVKLFVAITLTGYIVHAGSRLYSGASSDSVIQDDVDIEKFLQQSNVHTVADGGFRKTDRIATECHRMPQDAANWTAGSPMRRPESTIETPRDVVPIAPPCFILKQGSQPRSYVQPLHHPIILFTERKG